MAGIKNVVITILLAGFFLICFAAQNGRAASIGIIHPADSVMDTTGNPNGDVKIAACPNFGGDMGFGQLTLGIRAGACTLFDPGSIGFGLGFALRYHVAKQWSLEAYGDRFKTEILHLGYRTNSRYGINALYYWAYRPLRVHRFTRFILGGISYETNVIYSYRVNTADYGNSSPWLDLGVGEHYRLTHHWDITLELFYDCPLATHPASYLYTPEVGPVFLKAHYQDAFNLGGVFAILSLNYTISYM